MLIDEAKINASAGKGGDGVVSFDKNKMSLGPAGGRGGNGGNVFFQGVSNLTALNKYRNKRKYLAQNGNQGMGNRSSGKNGEDIFLTVPIGSVINNLDTNKSFEITKVGEEILAAKGGVGGQGNFFFRSPSNTTPLESEKGRSGESFTFLVELRLIADLGLIGFPNAGKSSLLNELTKADVKVGNYSFTTLEPNLGAFEDWIIADIPGLIEGASEGRGLGIKFLRHIQRTKILFHCLSAESTNLKADYQTVRKELKKYNPELTEKPEIIILTKSDIISDKEKKEKTNQLKKLGVEVVATSIHDFESLENLKKVMRSNIKQALKKEI
ncbi:MAG: GTPase ObgE [Candidatus Moranbacteria bacterium CG10_big_fil_rev_8_21_14_0_10_35_21]|nr:MAG: GTPase ObgE [Candidatus Moranbacteria bacterium CG10_big_fil_rev_8_21_14_0_10_35_21]